MDRVTVFPGQLPLETDMLRAGKYALIGAAKLAEAVLGTDTQVDGFTLTPTAPASMSLILGPGQVYQTANTDPQSWSSLPPDVHNIVKQGLLLDPTTITLVAPTTVGYAQNVLVEVQYADSDTGNVVRPYYNASNPQVPFQGPGNAGTADSTVRSGVVAYQLKYGAAASSGSQTTPTPDAGWAGLYVVTLAFGQTSITQNSISLYYGAPFITTKLGKIKGTPFNRTSASTQPTYYLAASDVGTLFYGQASIGAQTTYVLPSPALFGIGYLGFQNNYDDKSSITVQTTLGASITLPGRGAATQTLNLAAYKSFLLLFCDGANWIVVSASADLSLAPFGRTFAPSTTSYTLTNRDNGTLFYGRAATGATTTYILPNPSSFGPGYLAFQNNYDAASSLVINASTGAVVAPGAPNGLTSITMSVFKSFMLLYSDGSNWVVVSSTPDLFGGALAKSLGLTGYVKRFDGIIEQWGSVPSINAGSAVVVTFPTAFNTPPDFYAANPSDAGASVTYRYNAGGPSTTGMTIVNTSTGTVAGGVYFARGR